MTELRKPSPDHWQTRPTTATPTCTCMTPEASLRFILSTRCRSSECTPADADHLPALRKLSEENTKAHENAIEYWCDNATTLLSSPSQQADSSPCSSSAGRLWPFEADAAAAEDARMLCERVTSRCLSVRRCSPTKLFDAAVLDLINRSSYATTTGTRLTNSGATRRPGSDSSSQVSLSATSGDDDGDDEQVSSDSDETESIVVPLSPEAATKRYRECCEVFHATPLPSVLERLRQPSKDAVQRADVLHALSGHAPLNASSSALTDQSASLSSSLNSLIVQQAGASTSNIRAYQLPAVDYAPNPVKPSPVCVPNALSVTSPRTGTGDCTSASSVSGGVGADNVDDRDTVNVSHCPLLGTPDAFIPLLGFLHGLVYVRRLNVAKTDLQTSCFAVLLLLCEAYLPNIEDIDVSGNPRLSDAGAAAVFHFLRSSPKMRRMCLKQTAMRPSTIARVDRILRSRNTAATLSPDGVDSTKSLGSK